MSRLEPCFYALADFERRVLSMRAGLAGQRASSRGHVARRLRVTTVRVHRSERIALRKLRTVNRSEGCARAPAIAQGRRWAAALTTLLVGDSAGTSAPAGGSGGRVRVWPIGDDDRGEVLGARASKDADGGGASLAPPAAANTAVLEDDVDRGLVASILASVLLAMIAGFVLAARRGRVAEAVADARRGRARRIAWTGLGASSSEDERDPGPAPWADQPEQPSSTPEQPRGERARTPGR